jgi:integrase
MSARPVKRLQPWNEGLLVGQKEPLEPKHVWSIGVRLEIAQSKRDLAIFNLAIDSKLRACDLVRLRVDDICSGAKVRRRATIVQRKTGRTVQFEITDPSRSAVEAWLPMLRATGSRFLFPSRLHASPPAVYPAGAPLGREYRPRAGCLRHALDEADEGGPDLPQNRQPSRCPTSARPYKAGEHRPISRDRGR